MKFEFYRSTITVRLTGTSHVFNLIQKLIRIAKPKHLIPVVLTLFCLSCSGPKVLIKPGVPIQTLGVNLEIAQEVHPAIRQGFENQFDDFITRYNAANQNRFILEQLDGPCTSCLTIKVVASQLVTPGQQTAGVLVSLAGFSMPIIMASSGAPFYIWFYYFPRAKSLTEVSLSNDINGSPYPATSFVLQSPGFLKSPERQVDKHIVYFDRFLTSLLKSISMQYARHKPGPVQISGL